MSDSRYALNTTGKIGIDTRINLIANETTFSFLQSGDLFEIINGSTMINQIRGNLIDGSMNNIYLRVYNDEGHIETVLPLLGINSTSEFAYNKETNQAKWFGADEALTYEVIFSLTESGAWFWHIIIEAGSKQVDIIYTQDVGLAGSGMIQANEAYTAQYVDYKVFEEAETGYVVCSRQNQPQDDGSFPYLQQGALTKAISYSTDGYQFFGLDYKETDIAEALFSDQLADTVYQYEFGYVALLSEKKTGTVQEIFYGIAKADQPSAITELDYLSEIKIAWENVKVASEFTSVTTVKHADNINFPLQTTDMTMKEIDDLFPERLQEEIQDGELLSFFTPTHEHIVLKEKELQVERSHGHILLSGDHLTVNDEVMTTTSYMYGVFNAQIVIGNTTMNKMMSNVRNGLNVMKTAGQRIYVDVGNGYQLLTMPSMYEMGFNYARWYYKTEADTLVITNFVATKGTDITLSVKSMNNKSYRFMVTNQIIMNEKEYEVPFKMTTQGETLTFYVDESAFASNYYSELVYHLHVAGTKANIVDERSLLSGAEATSASLVVLEIDTTADFILTMQGKINGGIYDAPKRDFVGEVATYRNHFATVMNGFKLSQDGDIANQLEKMNVIVWWYTHNMFIHYLAPHGLEQYGGAAWGTHDVCQGPFEYFLAMGRHDIMRSILLTVFSNQFEDDGNWPQWFMFDKYVDIRASESHGDIIAWPLFVIGTYLNVTEDNSILDEEIPYFDRKTNTFTIHTESLFTHVKKEINYIKDNFLHDTHLSCYGDGDWDDTLQPHDGKLKKYMASSWTVGLTYKGMKSLATALASTRPAESAELAALAKGIEADYRKYIMTMDVIPGFLYLEDVANPEFMIHPTDDKLGIDYRLLPMQQSIIAELFTPEEVAMHLKIIREHLQCPDGVRLMNKPATYVGGVSSKFKRAEQASNFGREIGLQYVHAHIRFIEAMAKLGEAKEAWNGLFVINPVNLHDSVPNAEIRQSNSYFSSSDGKFNDRYEAEANFDKLRTGNVAVKGGWRIYSSGPGIYLNQVVSNVLGIRVEGAKIVVDPVLTADLDGLKFEFMLLGKKVTFNYHLTNMAKKVVINGTEVAGVATDNRYREGGLALDKATVASLLIDKENMFDIYA